MKETFLSRLAIPVAVGLMLLLVGAAQASEHHHHHHHSSTTTTFPTTTTLGTTTTMPTTTTDPSTTTTMVSTTATTGSTTTTAPTTTTTAPTTTTMPVNPAFAPNSGWQVACFLAVRASNDPIVFPGQPGASHSHDFFGNKTTDASSTPASLLGQPTTCKETKDAAAYWAPTLYINGVAVQPEKVVAYYRTKVGPVQQAIPAGLEMIAGDHAATAAQPFTVTYYNCDSGPDQHESALPYACPGSVLDSHIKFPQCWDGVNLDSADHKSHMAYPVSGSCPASHPVSVPQLIMRISWNTQAGTGFTLASGSPYTMHADFMNGWDQAKLEQLTRDCMNAGINCGTQLSP